MIATMMIATIMIARIAIAIILTEMIIIWPAALCNSGRHSSPVTQAGKP
jgi:hypothetical protein